MFLECYNNNGYSYLRITEGYRVKKDDGTITIKKRIIKNLGPLSKFDDGMPDIVKRLKEAFKSGTLNIEGFEYGKNDVQNFITIRIDRNKALPLAPKNIGYFFLEDLYKKLGIAEILTSIKSRSKLNYDLNGLTKLLVLGRILDPSSKKFTFENRDKYFMPPTSSNDLKEIYRTLDILSEKSNMIQKKTNMKINDLIGRNNEVTYYDVTNYYFETSKNDEDTFDESTGEYIDGLRKKGVSKENKQQPIVQMGLFIDNNGIPISYSLHPGNMQDKSIFKDEIINNINNSNLGRIVVVCDKGMQTQGNIYLLTEKGNGYIISKSIKSSWKICKDWVENKEDYKLITDKKGEVTFRYKSRIIGRDVSNSLGEKKIIKEKEIIFWSKNHYERQLHNNKKLYDYLESCKESPSKLKAREKKIEKFVKVIHVDKKTGEEIKTRKKVIILDEKLEKEKEVMGYYLITTSEIDENDENIINRYHGLSRIEDSFRIIKSDLEGRPVYVRTKKHIDAHFLICFLSLTIIRLLQYKVLRYENKDTLNTDGWEQGITAEKLKKSLGNFNVNHLKDEYYQVSELEKELQLLMKVYGLEEILQMPTRTELKQFKNKINF